MKIEDLSLSKRVRNILARNNCFTLEDLLICISDGELPYMRLLGPVRVKEILNKLDEQKIPYDISGMEEWLRMNRYKTYSEQRTLLNLDIPHLKAAIDKMYMIKVHASCRSWQDIMPLSDEVITTLKDVIGDIRGSYDEYMDEEED